MSNNSQTNPTDLPPIDISKININIVEIEAPDYRLDFEVPVDLIAEITTRIKSGGLDYDEKQMGNLIIQVCLDEGMSRFDRDSAWGTRLLNKSIGRYSNDEPFTFSAIVDTLPEKDFSIDSIPIKRNQLSVDDELVDIELLEQQLQFGTRTEFMGKLAHGDEINCKATITLPGEEEPDVSIEECSIRIPSDSQKFVLAGLPLEQLGPQLRGCQCAEELSFELDFPEDYPARKFRGNKATLVLSNCTFIRIHPSTIEHVLEQYGTTNEAILRTQIKMSLQNNFDRESTNFMLHQMYNYLFENIELPISKRMINKKFETLCKKELEATGKEELTDAQKITMMNNVEKVVKRHTLNAWFQRTFKMKISEDEIDKQAAIIAAERRVRPADVKDEFLANDQVSALASMALERKIFDRLKDKMIFTDAT